MYLPDLFLAENALLSYYDPTISVGSLACRHVVRNGAVYFSVQGTNNIGDWITDLKFPLVTRIRDGKPVKIEQGFAEGADSLYQPVLTALEPFKSLPIYGSAHSLGCALLRQLLAFLVEQGFTVSGCLCLESPMVGDLTFEQYYQSTDIATLHIRHGADGVPTLPGTELGYSSPLGATVILGSDGIQLAAQPFPPGWEIISCLDATIRDHSCGEVLGALRKWLGFQAVASNQPQ